MDSLIRISVLSNRVKVGDAAETAENILAVMKKTTPFHPDVIVLPALALTGVSCGSMFRSRKLLSEAKDVLETLRKESEKISGYLIFGLPILEDGKLLSVTAVLSRGDIIALLPASETPGTAFQNEVYGAALPLFQVGEVSFAVVSCDWHSLLYYAVRAVDSGAQILVVPAYGGARAGEISELRRSAEMISKSLGIGIVIACGGVGETTSPQVSRAFCGVYECGREMSFKITADEQCAVSVDLDEDILLSSAKCGGGVGELLCSVETSSRHKVLRTPKKNPFLPWNSDSYLDDLFELQAAALAGRMENTGIDKLVLGVSGGVDSALALLVASRALSLLGLDQKNLIGVTMPGFGTTDRTYNNAMALMEGLGAEIRKIPIDRTVLSHFADIGHDREIRDITYENAQARERMQVLFSIANSAGGLVVGTGDLSEAALGWSTFGGDHFASFNINIALTKTLVRAVLKRLAEQGDFTGIGDVIRDILDTPVSPELLPTDDAGEQKQKSEDILGPYEIHEFFLYYFVKYGMKPAKIYEYACMAFRREYDNECIAAALRTFLRRFVTNQFKRANSPESADITEISLNEYSFPADMSPEFLLREIEL